MKNKKFISLVAAAVVSIPAIASAGEPVQIGSEVDSTLDINLRITKKGLTVERVNGSFSRLVTSRFGSRELIAAIEELVQNEQQGFTGFPRGSRLMLLDGDVWVVESRGARVMDVSQYFYFEFAAEPITAGTFREGSESTQTQYLMSVGFNLGGRLQVSVNEEIEVSRSGMSAELRGIASNRYNLRERQSRGRYSRNVSSSTSADVQGAGHDDGAAILVKGTIRMNGRESINQVTGG